MARKKKVQPAAATAAVDNDAPPMTATKAVRSLIELVHQPTVTESAAESVTFCPPEWKDEHYEVAKPRNGDKIAFVDATGCVHTTYLDHVKERKPGVWYGEFIISGGRKQGADWDQSGEAAGTFRLI